ncbi:Fatty acid synthesis protein, partial [Caldanaerobius fijiensis DSM 17918]
MKIAVDAMGGDNAPYEIVKGAVLAANEMNEQIVLIGKSDEINSILQRENAKLSNIEVVHAPDVIKGEDSPVAAIRSKRESSMYIGLEMLRDKECDAFVSAGNTGALMAGALMVVGRIKGIKRPALAPIIPTRTGNM